MFLLNQFQIVRHTQNVVFCKPSGDCPVELKSGRFAAVQRNAYAVRFDAADIWFYGLFNCCSQQRVNNPDYHYRRIEARFLGLLG